MNMLLSTHLCFVHTVAANANIFKFAFSQPCPVTFIFMEEEYLGAEAAQDPGYVHWLVDKASSALEALVHPML